MPLARGEQVVGLISFEFFFPRVRRMDGTGWMVEATALRGIRRLGSDSCQYPHWRVSAAADASALLAFG